MTWTSMDTPPPEPEDVCKCYLVWDEDVKRPLICKWYGIHDPDRPWEQTGWKLPYNFTHWMELPGDPKNGPLKSYFIPLYR